MKRFLLLFLVLFTCNIIIPKYSFAVNVPDRIRLGLKYNDSAVSNMEIASKDGFYIRAQGASNFPIAKINNNKVKVNLPIKNNVDSYFIVEQSGFKYYEDALNYCKSEDYSCTVYYRNNSFYAVREELYSENDMQYALNKAKEKNPTSYSVAPSKSKIRLSTPEGQTILIFSQDDGEILGLSSTTDGTLNIGKEQDYRDVLEFQRKGDLINVISNVTMQHYLYSVVPAEIGASAPFEAQKAQAVCARTYAVKNYNKHSKDGFNLCATTDCQMYIGTKWERESSTRSVDETLRQIATYKGEPISAVYSAHSGGRTADVADVWGTPYDYLKSVEDIYCTDYTWEVEIDYNSLSASLAGKGYDLGNIISLNILERSACDRVLKLEIVGDKATKVFEKERARTILGLKSQMYYIQSSGITYDILSSAGIQVKNIVNHDVLTPAGKISINKFVTIKNGKGEVQTLKESPVIKITGKGNGHGVGLSQHGAMGYAEAGWDYIKILKHYYKGIEIEGI